jgi:hypothetical protein
MTNDRSTTASDQTTFFMLLPLHVRYWLIGVAGLLVLVTLYRAWSATSQLEQTLYRAEHELAVARDSLAQAQVQIDYMVREIGNSQRALRIISEQVQRAHLQHEAQREADGRYRQALHRQWQAQREARQALLRVAQQYAVE